MIDYSSPFGNMLSNIELKEKYRSSFGVLIDLGNNSPYFYSFKEAVQCLLRSRDDQFSLCFMQNTGIRNIKELLMFYDILNEFAKEEVGCIIKYIGGY